MSVYSVQYELKALPSDVIVEVFCNSKEEADQVYKERKNSGACVNVTLKN